MHKDAGGASPQMTGISDPDRGSQIEEFTREWLIYIVEIYKNALIYNGWSVKKLYFHFQNACVSGIFVQKHFFEKKHAFLFFFNVFIHLSPDTKRISKKQKSSFCDFSVLGSHFKQCFGYKINH